MVKVERLGLAVGDGAIRALGLHRGAIVWAGTAPFADVSELEGIATELLSQAPRFRRWVRAGLAVGPGRSQARRIDGLPPIRDGRTVAQLVSQDLGRFFLRNGVPLVSGSAVRGSEDSWWVAAFEESLLTAIANACRKARVRLEAIHSTVTLVPAVLGLDGLTWRDEAVVVTTKHEAGRLAEVRRSSLASEASTPSLPAVLETLGESARSYLDAYAAAIGTGDPRSPAYELRSAERSSPLPRWRLIAAAAAVFLAAAAALSAPVLGPYGRALRAEHQAAALGPSAGKALALERELRRFQAALAAFDGLSGQSSPSRLHVLVDLSRALPPDAALSALRVDSVGGQLAVLAPRVGAVLDRLERSGLLSSPQVVGPITRERSGDRERERATVKFVLR